MRDWLICGPLHSITDVLGDLTLVPNSHGVYGMWFDSLPVAPIEGCIQRDGRYLMYIGSTKRLRERLRDDHNNKDAAGSTLRLTLGVLLGFELRRHETIKVESGERLTFWLQERALTDWLEKHTSVCWIACSDPGAIEKELFCDTSIPLPLNIQGNTHPFGSRLRTLRGKAKTNARSLPSIPKREVTIGSAEDTVTGLTCHV